MEDEGVGKYKASDKKRLAGEEDIPEDPDEVRNLVMSRRSWKAMYIKSTRWEVRAKRPDAML